MLEVAIGNEGCPCTSLCSHKHHASQDVCPWQRVTDQAMEIGIEDRTWANAGTSCSSGHLFITPHHSWSIDAAHIMLTSMAEWNGMINY